MAALQGIRVIEMAGWPGAVLRAHSWPISEPTWWRRPRRRGVVRPLARGQALGCRQSEDRDGRRHGPAADREGRRAARAVPAGGMERLGLAPTSPARAPAPDLARYLTASGRTVPRQHGGARHHYIALSARCRCSAAGREAAGAGQPARRLRRGGMLCALGITLALLGAVALGQMDRSSTRRWSTARLPEHLRVQFPHAGMWRDERAPTCWRAARSTTPIGPRTGNTCRSAP